MTWFRDFTAPLWQVFGGNLLMFVTLVFYSAWWTVSFRPNGDANAAGAGLFIAVAFFAGVAAIAVLFTGINSFSQAGKGFPMAYILAGAAASFVILLAVTQIVFRRPVTSELLLIVIWAALEWSAIAALQGSGRFSLGATLTLAVLVALATCTGMACYLLHYHLVNETLRFWNGLIPLIAPAGVVAVFLAVQALS